MLLFKKFFFSLPFIITFIVYCLLLNPFLKNPSLLLSIDQTAFIAYMFLAFFVLFTSLFFAVFTTLCQEWKMLLIILPAIFLSSYLLMPIAPQIIFAVPVCFLFAAIYASLQKKLREYLTFQPDILLSPSIKQTTTLLLLVGSLMLYFSEKQIIQQKGFLIPQSLIDTSLAFIPKQASPEFPNQNLLPPLLEELKKNPQLFGQQIPKDTQSLTKTLLTNQINTFLKPYESFIPFIFSLIFFFTLKSLVSFLGIFLGPLIRFVFWILEKTHYTTYTTEVRTVKKLIVDIEKKI